jgi:cystathionine beta-lyase
MKYDFDTVIDRRSTTSLKWNVKENELPMWVADMDFKTAPCVLEALESRVKHGKGIQTLECLKTWLGYR